MAAFRPSVAALVLLLNLSSVRLCWPVAQQSEKPLRIGISLVTLDVSVTDRRRRFVGDLDRKDFVVKEDGIEQNIDSFLNTSSTVSGEGITPRGRAGSGANRTIGPATGASGRFSGYRFISIVVDNSSMEPANR